MQDKKPLQTVWINGKWQMYSSMIEQNRHHTIDIPSQDEIESNPTYQKYMQQCQDNNLAAITDQTKALQHEKGYHRQYLTAFVVASIAIIGLLNGNILFPINNIVGRISQLNAAQRNTTSPAPGMSETQIDINNASLLLSVSCIALSILALSYAGCLNKSKDRSETEKKLFEQLKSLRERLPAVQEEIALKNRVIERLQDFLANNDHRSFVDEASPNRMSLADKNSFFEILVIALDEYNDLNVYEGTRLALRTASYVDRPIAETIYRYLVGKFHAKFFERNSEYFDAIDNPLDKARDFYPSLFQLVSHVKREPPLNTENYEGSMDNWFAETLIAILHDENKIKAYSLIFSLASLAGYNLILPKHLHSIVSCLKDDDSYNSLCQNIELFQSDSQQAQRLLLQLTAPAHNPLQTISNLHSCAELMEFFFESLDEQQRDDFFTKLITCLLSEKVFENLADHFNPALPPKFR